MIGALGCNHVNIRGVTVVDGPTWHCRLNCCRDIVIENVNLTPKDMTGDGWTR